MLPVDILSHASELNVLLPGLSQISNGK